MDSDRGNRCHSWILAVLLVATGHAAGEQDVTCAASDIDGDALRSQAKFASRLMSTRGYRKTLSMGCGVLGEGRDAGFSLNVPSDRHLAIAAFCGPGCTDIDLTLHHEKGPVVRDTLPDDLPFTEVAVASTRTHVLVRLTMVRCTASVCRYGVAVFGN
jgi:hypothetical protein